MTLSLIAPLLAGLLGLACVHLQAGLLDGVQMLGVLAAAVFALPLALRASFRSVRLAAWIVLAAALGFAYGNGRAHWALADELSGDWEGADVTVVGLIATLPQTSPGMFGVEGRRFQFQLETVLTQGATVPSRVLLTWYGQDGALPDLRAGDRWRLTVRLRRPHGLMNPHGFDHELWLLEQGLRATGSVRPGAELLGRAAAYPVERWRQSLRDAIEARVEDRRSAGVLAALSLGDQAAIDRADWTLFRQTGVAHLMSISGLHVTMFAWLVGGVIGRVWRLRPAWMLTLPAPQAALWGGVLAAFLYAIFAGWGVPAQRTVWMLLTVAVLKQVSRQWPWPLILLAAAWVVCIIDPWALSQAGFWLSFTAVGLLTASGAGSESGVAPADRPLLQRLGAALRAAWHTQWVATSGLAPLTLLLFQQVSLVGLVANMVAIPVVTLLITPLALLGAVIPAAWTVAATLVQLLSEALAVLATPSWAVWQVPVAPLWAQACGLLAGLLWVLPLPWQGRVLSVPLALPFLWPHVPGPPLGRFEVLVADVGQGTAVLVRTQGHVLLYDAGPAYGLDSNAGQRVLLPLLRAQGVSSLDLLMLSHRDTDHVAGAASLIHGLQVRALRSSLEPEHPLLKQSVPHARCEAGQQWVWDGVRFEVLHPASAFYDADRKPNTLSCVLRVSTPSQSLLLTGDLEAAQELALVERLGERLRSQVMLVPHHGSKTSSTPAFLEAVAPHTAVVQAGYLNRFGHPVPGVMARYAARGITIITTVDCGAWSWDGGRGQCERERRRRYWHAKGQGEDSDSEMSARPVEPDQDLGQERPASVESPL